MRYTALSAGPRYSIPTVSMISIKILMSQTENWSYIHHGVLTDSTSLIRIIQQFQPDEIYNPAAQSHVAGSFEEPKYTANSDALGALRMLEAIRILGLETKTRCYHVRKPNLK